MHDLRHDPDATIHTHAVPEKGYTVTWTEGPVAFVPASPPSHTVGEVAFHDVPAKYGIPTSTDRIDALTAQVDALREQQAAIAQKLRWISEQLALLAGDVPFAGRIAEDECGHA